MAYPEMRKPAPALAESGPRRIVVSATKIIKTDSFNKIEHSQLGLNVQAARFLQRRFAMTLHTARAVASLAGKVRKCGYRWLHLTLPVEQQEAA